MSRSKAQREQDRADILAVLDDADGQLSTIRVAERVYGGDVTEAWRHMQQVLADLNVLARAGEIAKVRRPGWSLVFWEIPTGQTLTAREEQDDVDDIRRQMARWEPADELADDREAAR